MPRKSQAQLKREIDAALAKIPPKKRPTIDQRTFENGQLYWDDQDPNNGGWWLRYRDDQGTEQGTEIDAQEDAGIEELATAIDAETHRLPGNGKIKVFRGDEPRGTITLAHGKVSDWRVY